MSTENDNKISSSGLNNVISKKIMEKFYLDKETADIRFVFEVKDPKDDKPIEIVAHKNVLAKGSKVFRSMFNDSVKEEKEVQIADVTPDGFRHFLQFFYLDVIEPTMDSIYEVMFLADKYDVKECLIFCEGFLLKTLKFEDICLGYELAISYERMQLKEFCEEKINENPITVFQSNAFLDCEKSTLKHLLDIDYQCYDGKQLFDACMAWAKHKCEEQNLDASSMDNLRQQLGDCIYDIQFGLMSLTQLFELIKAYKGLFNAEELEEIVAIISSNGDVSLKLFNSKTHISQIRQNQIGSLIECVRYNYSCGRCASSSNNCNVEPCQVASFHSNKQILLCAVSCIKYLQLANSPTGTIVIVEKASSQNNEKILLKQTVEFRKLGQYVNLDKAIVIQPTTRYEIRINFDSSVSQQQYYIDISKFVKKVKIGGHCITFEKPDDSTHCIIASLYFGPIA